MTCKVNADTTNGLKLTSDTSGEIDLQTNGTTKVHMDSSGNVGIGTSSPDDGKLNISGYAAGSRTFLAIKNNNDTDSYFRVTRMGTAADANVTLANNYNRDSGFSSDDNTAGVSNIVFQDDGDLSFGTASSGNSQPTTRMKIDFNGNVLISGTTYNSDVQNLAVGMCAIGDDGRISIHSSVQPLELARTYGDNSSRHLVQFYREGSLVGIISSTNTTTTYSTSSDYRLKENVNYTWDATSRLKQLKPARFNFIADADTTVDGFIAHEVSDIVPEAISGEKDAMMTEEYEVTPAVLDDDGNIVEEAVMGTREVPDYQGIDQSKLVPLLVKTIQELEARITALENN